MKHFSSFLTAKMPSITASIEYLADIDLYKTEKPWSGLLIGGKKHFNSGQRLDNIELTYHDCDVQDVRENQDLPFDKTGFQLYKQKSPTLSEFDTIEKLETHQAEMAAFLTEKLDAVYVKTYDCHTRLNVDKTEDKVDVMDLLNVDAPARGAHNGRPIRMSRMIQQANGDDRHHVEVRSRGRDAELL